MNVLLLGSGGREHALAWKIAQSNLLDNLYIAPGNAGTSSCGVNLPLDINDFSAIENTIRKYNIRMVVAGPEAPLVDGLHDHLAQKEEFSNLQFIGPKKAGAMLEGSKDFAKGFMKRNNIPTAGYQTFSGDTISRAMEYINTLTPPYVIKADGLAAGKGVIIAQTIEEAQQTLTSILTNKQFGDAGNKVVIEEFLDGIEMSVFVLTDGSKYYLLPEAKDYKRIGEGDTGLNTGGMGSVSPVPFADKELMQRITTDVIEPTISGLQKENIPYIGFIFFGLMVCDGNPYVIEYNVRMGDPETESVIPRLKSDLLKAMNECAKGTIKEQPLEFDSRFATSVMLVSKGYPGAYTKGIEMTIPQETFNGVLFHAGTKTADNRTVVTNGGRVLAVTAYGNTMDEALKTAYQQAEKIHFEGKTQRNDLGFDLKKYC